MSTISDIIAALPEKASRISSSEAIKIFNYNLMEDLLPGLYGTFQGDFEAVQEIDIDTDVATSYALNSDFREYYGLWDQNGNFVYERVLTSLDSDRDAVQFLDDDVVVDTSTTITKLIIEYYKQPTLITSVTQDIPFPTRVQARVFSLLVDGMAYFYYRLKKKTVDAQFIYPDYEDLKRNIFRMSHIGT